MKRSATEWFHSYRSLDQYDILIRCGYPRELILDDGFELSEQDLQLVCMKESNRAYVQETNNDAYNAK